MPIRVICPGCHARFQVSDKFAGQRGPCPKCKTPITIPAKNEEVVIHEPEQFGPKGVTGEAVLKPLERAETKVSPLAWAAMGISCFVVLVVALLLRSTYTDSETQTVAIPLLIKAVGAVLLAPPLVLAGYSFLRDQELEPYRGAALWLRVAICSAVYALLWAAYSIVCSNVLRGDPQIFQLMFLVPPLGLAGAVAAYASLDLELGSGFLHYSLYLLVTVLLLFMMGDPPFATLV